MPSGKRTLLLILTPILPLLLFALAFDYGVVKTVGSPGSVKQVLRDSGLYSSLVPSLLKQSGAIETSVGSISTNDPLVSQAVTKAVPPADVQKNVEGAIDNIYGWLDGKTPQPTFNISLAGSQSAFAQDLSAAVGQRLALLPACSTTYTASSFDALNATCLPKGVSAETAAMQLQSEIGSGSGLDKANLSASDLKGDTPGQSVFSDQLKTAPAQYQRLKKTPVILALLTIIVAAVLIFLRPTWQSGLRHVGLSILIVGLVMLVFSWVFNSTATKHFIPKLRIQQNASLQKNLQDGLTDLSLKLEHNYWLFGGIYTVAGLAMLATPLLVAKRSGGVNAASQEQPAPPQKKSSENSPKK